MWFECRSHVNLREQAFVFVDSLCFLFVKRRLILLKSKEEVDNINTEIIPLVTTEIGSTFTTCKLIITMVDGAFGNEFCHGVLFQSFYIIMALKIH